VYDYVYAGVGDGDALNGYDEVNPMNRLAPSLLAVLLSVHAAADNLRVLSQGYGVYTVRKGAKFCVDRKYTFRAIPPEFDGLRAIQTRMGDKSGSRIEFALAKASRVYALFAWPRGLRAKRFGVIPDGWRRYRLAFPSDDRHAWNIYYRDFKAGKNVIEANSSYVVMGVQPLDELTARERIVPDIRSGSPEIVFKRGEKVSVKAIVGNFSGRTKKVRFAWTFSDGANRALATKDETLWVPPGGLTRALEFGSPPSAMYFLEAEFTWDGGGRRSIRYPIYVRRELDRAKPPPKDAIAVFCDVRQIGGVGDPELVVTRLHAVADALRCLGCRGMYANLNKKELDIAQQYGMRVVMDARETVPYDVKTHPALYAWFGSKIVNRKDLPGYKAQQQALAKTVFKDRPYLYKPMSFVASKLGSANETFNPLLLWRALDPSIRTLRCVPFSGECNALRPNTRAGGLDYNTLFAIAELCHPAPWWFMTSVYGQAADVKADAPGRRIPTGPELSALCHLALANGARNLFMYRAIQDMDSGVIHGETMRPVGTAMDGLRRVGSFLEKAGPILAGTRPAARRATTDRLHVVIRPRIKGMGRNASHYLYVINLNDEENVTTVVSVDPLKSRRPKGTFPVSKAADCVTGKPVELTQAPNRTQFRLSLERGEGRLMQIWF